MHKNLNAEHSTLNAKNNLSPELLFLIACCQTNPSEDLALNADTPVVKTKVGCDTEFILFYLNSKLQNDDTETSFLIPLASRHGVLPLIYKTIKRLSTDHSSFEKILTELKAHYMSISQRNMLMSAELIRIMKLLEKNSIEALPFKGPTLSQIAYGDITLRQYSDLDILVKKENIYKIDTLLKAQGYQRLLDITPTQEKVYIQYAHDIGLIHPKKGIHFEMHWSLLDEDYPMQIDLEDFWEKTQKTKLNRFPVPTFSNENLLYYLCIHGSKHLWERIEWIKDLDMMIKNETIDWNALMAKVEGSGFEKMVYLGLLLSASLFETPLPVIIQKQIRKYQQLNSLSNFVLESWQTPKSTFAKTAAMLKLFPGVKEQVIYLNKIIFKPSFNEYWYVDLPKGFYWGYYLVRPYLLLKKYFTGEQKRNS